MAAFGGRGSFGSRGAFGSGVLVEDVGGNLTLTGDVPGAITIAGQSGATFALGLAGSSPGAITIAGQAGATFGLGLSGSTAGQITIAGQDGATFELVGDLTLTGDVPGQITISGGFGTMRLSGVTGEQPAGKSGKKPSRRKRRSVVVTIDGEDFVVSSEAEAESLLVAARETAEQKATAEAAAVVRKRQVKASKGSRLNTGPVTLDRPEVSVASASDSRADQKWLNELLARFTEAIDSGYEKASRDAELSVLMAARAVELDEEDQLVAILFTL